MKTKSEIKMMLEALTKVHERLNRKGYSDTQHFARVSGQKEILEWVLEGED